MRLQHFRGTRFPEFRFFFHIRVKPAEQRDVIEKLQMRVLKVIYGWNYAYEIILTAQNIPPLKALCEESVKNFALKAAKNP